MLNRCDEPVLIRVCVQIELIMGGRGERHDADLHVAGADIKRLHEPGHEIQLLFKVDGPYRTG